MSDPEMFRILGEGCKTGGGSWPWACRPTLTHFLFQTELQRLNRPGPPSAGPGLSSRSLSPGLRWSAPAEPWASTPADWLPGEACRPHVNNHRLPITAVQGRADDGPAGLTGGWRWVEATGPAVGTRPG